MGKRNNIVSIIVPAYNVENYLGRCIESILKQTYTEYEIIIVDDGSIDNTLSVAMNYSTHDDRIKVHHKDNGGVSSARNYGIEVAIGKYLCFIDADDYVKANYLQQLLKGFEPGIELSIVNYFYDRNNEIELRSYHKLGYFRKKEILNSIYDSNEYLGYLFNKCFLGEIIRKNRIHFNEAVKIQEDLLFCIQYIDYIERIYISNINLYGYCIRESSATANKNSIRNETQIIALRKICEIAKKYGGIFENQSRERKANLLVCIYFSGGIQCNNMQHIRDLQIELSNDFRFLTFKHRIMYLLIRFFPKISIKLARIRKNYLGL